MLTPSPAQGNVDWFVHDRFGMFIHWGLYSLAARHEWVKYNETIPDAIYQRYFTQFNPDLYNPREWACAARRAGMKYAWKSPEQLIQLLISSVASGGNLIMNTGPTARGTFDQRALDSLDVYTGWMRLHSRAIYGCTQSEYIPPQDCRYTQNGRYLYLHIYNWPFRFLYLDGMAGRIQYAQFLHDGSEVAIKSALRDYNYEAVAQPIPETTAVIELPVRKPAVVVPVIELLLK